MADKVYELEIYNKEKDVDIESEIILVITDKELKLEGELAEYILLKTKYNIINSITELTKEEIKENINYYKCLNKYHV